MRKYYKEPKLCDFNKVQVSIPRYRIIKLLLKRNYLDIEETVFLKAVHWKVESAINKLNHVLSLTEKALLKRVGSRVNFPET